MNILVKVLPLMAVAALAACAGVESRVRSGTVANVIDQSPVHSGFIEAIGIGSADPLLATATQRKALARDAAIVKAQYELLSIVKGVNLEGGITVARAIEKDSELSTQLEAAIAGAEIRKSEFTNDNGCVVTLRLPKQRLATLMGVRLQ